MKHIIIAIDGTGRSAATEVFHSNVFRLGLALAPQDKKQNPQIFIYSSGVGTFGKDSKIWSEATGDGLDQLILNAYVNLVSNYCPRDKIYIFGFSRGAVAARALSGLISKAGLLKDSSSSLIEQVWEFFLGHEQKQSVPVTSLHQNVKIEFVGVWDTVPGPVKRADALQLFEALRIRGYRLDGSVKRGIHIVALDETRAEFAPLVWDACQEGQVLEQIWMPGAHTDVGGGYADSFVATASLITMLDKLRDHCPDLKFDEKYIFSEFANIFKRQEVYIHAEPRILREQVRRIDPIKERNQTVHPLANFLTGKDVNFRTKKNHTRGPYKPKCELPQTDDLLVLTRFRRNSFYLQLVSSDTAH